MVAPHTDQFARILARQGGWDDASVVDRNDKRPHIVIKGGRGTFTTHERHQSSQEKRRTTAFVKCVTDPKNN
jgi:hypothetical protein